MLRRNGSGAADQGWNSKWRSSSSHGSHDTEDSTSSSHGQAMPQHQTNVPSKSSQQMFLNLDSLLDEGIGGGTRMDIPRPPISGPGEGIPTFQDKSRQRQGCCEKGLNFVQRLQLRWLSFAGRFFFGRSPREKRRSSDDWIRVLLILLLAVGILNLLVETDHMPSGTVSAWRKDLFKKRDKSSYNRPIIRGALLSNKHYQQEEHAGALAAPEVQIQQPAQNHGQHIDPRSVEHELGPVDVIPVPDVIAKEIEAEHQQGSTAFVPAPFDNYVSFHAAGNTNAASQPDLPVFWHVPKAGGSTMKYIMAGCFQIVLADEVGGQFGHAADTQLSVFEHDGVKYVNVDTTNPVGIERARSLGLVQSNLAQMMVTSYLYEMSSLFPPDLQRKGKLFTVLRDPIERAASMLKYLAKAKWEPTYDPKYATMTLEEYARSDLIENNWMTRFLSNELSDELNNNHLEIAKAVLREKFVIGLLPHLAESFDHFEKHFQWQVVNRPFRKKCVEDALQHGMNRNNVDPKYQVAVGSQAYALLKMQNNFDVKLYQYAETLFAEQSQHFNRMPRPLTGTLQ